MRRLDGQLLSLDMNLFAAMRVEDSVNKCEHTGAQHDIARL